MKKLLKFIPILVFAILLSSCSSVRVAADYDREANFDNYKVEVNRYWDNAVGYFERVPPGSLYTDQAKRYMEYYIPEYRP